MENKKTLNVLVTSIGSNTAICVIKGLRRQAEFGVYIVGTDINSREDIAGASFCDSFHTIPLAVDKEKYLQALKRIITQESIDLVIPINDIEHEVLAQNREITKPAYVLMSSKEAIDTCNDKLKTYQFFVRNSIPTVQTIAPRSLSISEVLAAGINYPFFAKPRRGVGSKDVYEIKDENDYKALLRRIQDPIVQEKAVGQEYTIDVFCVRGKLVAAVPRKRIEARAGVSYKGETEPDPMLVAYAQEISERLMIDGPANIQCFKKDGQVKFTEINPRFSGGLILTIEAGVNFPLLALKVAVGSSLSRVEDFRIVRMCRYLNEVFYETENIIQPAYSLDDLQIRAQSEVTKRPSAAPPIYNY
jgi:carbamoyl-phosphate synthase large subunit